MNCASKWCKSPCYIVCFWLYFADHRRYHFCVFCIAFPFWISVLSSDLSCSLYLCGILGMLLWPYEVSNSQLPWIWVLFISKKPVSVAISSDSFLFYRYACLTRSLTVRRTGSLNSKSMGFRCLIPWTLFEKIHAS